MACLFPHPAGVLPAWDSSGGFRPRRARPPANFHGPSGTKRTRPLLSYLLPALSFLSTATATATAAEPPPDFRYKVEVLAEGIASPMQLQQAPDGRIIFIEVNGRVKVFHPETRQVTEAGKLSPSTALENGLLGVALDPKFADNGWIYLFHSAPEFAGQFISRFTMKGDMLDLGSRKDLLTWEDERKECAHHAGGLQFGPDGCLYASVGDNTNPLASDGFSPLDTRPDREPWNAQRTAANSNDLRGKVLRIRPKPDGTYEIPPGNLFPPGTPKTRPEIFAMGFRNPWRFTVNPRDGVLYVGDVGPDAYEDKPGRGPRGFDTINQIRQAGYYGWPYVRGNEAYTAYDFATNQSGTKFDPHKLVNESVGNTGLRELPPVQPPLLWYPYGESKEFPSLGKGGRSACAGPVFHFTQKFRETGGLPEAFDGCLLIYDWQRPSMHWVRLDKTGMVMAVEPFTSAVRLAQGDDDGSGRFQIKRPSDMIFGQDGALYVLDYGETWGRNTDARLVRISYQHGNLAPVAKATAREVAGREPLTLQLSAEGSKDYEGSVLSYEWRLGGKVFAKDAAARLTIAEPGSYRVELQVTDAQGAVGTAFVPVMVGNSPPVVTIESPKDGDVFTPGEPIPFTVSVRDFEDGDSKVKPDEFGVRTMVSVTRKVAANQGGEIAPGLALMRQSDCFNCHTMSQPLVGPAFLAIADKYRGQAGAEEAAVGRVFKGSSGVWGPVGMLPHPQHNQDEIHIMVRWIFGLDKNQSVPGLARGLTGEIIAPNDTTSDCVLEVTYTDTGRPPIGALSGKARVVLHPRGTTPAK